MKNLFSKLTFLLTILAFLCSCSSQLSISKRRYNKGFYVHYNHQKPAQPKAERIVKAAPVAEEKPEVVVVNPPANPVKQPESVKNNLQSDAPVHKTKELPLVKANNEMKSLASAAHEPIKISRPSDLKPLSDFRVPVAGTSDGWGIIWLIVIILAILYILGLLLDVAGGSWLIHLLVVIIIIILLFKLLHIL